MLLLVLIAYQDFTSRSFYWLILPVLFGGFIYLSIHEVTVSELVVSSIINILFVLVQFIGVTVWMSVKNKRWVNILKQYIGVGDWLFFTSICFVFSPILFIPFFVISLILSLVFYLLYAKIVNRAVHTVPLAGLFSIITMVILIIELCFFPGITRNESLMNFVNVL
ncbi:MAG: hypothetical protein CVU05_08280 [Bacteroidetes bacterium HGW-Bacteroidetes-21]|nr:MAG: hypothetical protein CVU05_08280 [Bacteroidetes bacterium HGW-Bacteroidetes-21]